MRQDCPEPAPKRLKEDVSSTEDLHSKRSADNEESAAEPKQGQSINEESPIQVDNRPCSKEDDDPEMEEKRKEFEKMVEEFDFPYDISKCGKKKMIKKMKFEFFKKIKRKREKEKLKEKRKRKFE